jgi:sterol 3beta-glucosyltransferase
MDSLPNPLLSSSSLPPLSSSSLNILLCTSGTRGDLQPYCLLARQLQRSGHRVKLCTERRMQNVVEEYNIDYVVLEGDPAGLIFESEAQEALEKGSMMKLIKLTENWEKKFNKADILASYVTAARSFTTEDGQSGDAQIIIGAALTLLPTLCVAELVHATWVPVILSPTLPTSEFPLWALKGLLPSSCLYKWSYNKVFRMLWQSEAKWANPWRVQLGLSPMIDDRGVMDVIEKTRCPVIIAGSELLCGPRQRRPGNSY